MKKYFKIFSANGYRMYLFTISSFVFFPIISQAATMSFETASKKVSPGNEFVVAVIFDPADARVNAISGTIKVLAPLMARTVIDGHSLLPLWVEHPAISADGHTVTFAGIVPGGIGAPGEVMRFIAAASSAGTATIGAGPIQALDQGQEPKPVNVKIMPLAINVSGEVGTSTIDLNDTIAPEPFTVSIQSDPNVFNGASFAAFSANDKQSGIREYQAAYSYFFQPKGADWQTVISPLQIPDQGLGKIVWIKAIDLAGNERIGRAGTSAYYRNLTILAIIIVILLLCLAYYVRQRRGSRQFSSSYPSDTE